MIEKVGQKISVNLVYNHITGASLPKHIKWNSRVYTITKLGLHYTKFEGKTLMHIFSVCSQDHYFLLSFNTQSLQWILEQIADETTN